MSQSLLALVHATTGVLAALAALWLFVDILNADGHKPRRLRLTALLVMALMWMTYLFGGYWYVEFYNEEKLLILAGPLPAAHSFFMEAKEHVFLILLLLATWLPIPVFRTDVTLEPAHRFLILWSSGLLVLGNLAMEGAGALVSMGVKLALLSQ